MPGADAFNEEAATALSTYLDELFEGVFHENIATAGKTLTFLSVATYGYTRLSKSIIGQSDLSYSLSAHLRLAYERAVVFTNTDFSPKLAALLEAGRVRKRDTSHGGCADDMLTTSTASQPVSGRTTPLTPQEHAAPQTPTGGLLPLDAIKASHQRGQLTKEQKIAAWADIRRFSLAYFLVVSFLRVQFVTACTLRNALLVMIHVEDHEASKKAKAQSNEASSRWSSLKRFLKNRKEGKSSSEQLMEMMMSQALGALGSASLSSSSSPFANDGPEGICSPSALVDIVLDSAELVTEAALRVVDATLSQMDPVDRGECDEDDMSILLEVLCNTFQAPETWTLFTGIKSAMVDKVSAAITREHDEAMTSVHPSSRQPSRCPSEESSGPSGAAQHQLQTKSPHCDELFETRSGGLAPLQAEFSQAAPCSRSSSFHRATPPFELPLDTSRRLANYLHDVLCTSDDVDLISDTVLHRELARLRALCMGTFVSNPKYGCGMRPTLVAASMLDKFRQQVHDDRIEGVPHALQTFSQELVKGHSKQLQQQLV
jgi:hypothetical protein